MIRVPESVLAYFQQPAVETAVDLLLSGKEPKVPGNLRWEDVSSFYRACLAARQVTIEYAIFLEEVWREVWIDGPTGWKPCPPSAPARPDLGVGVGNVWSEGCFSRRFERKDLALELSVFMWTEKGLQLGILLYDEQETVLLDAAELEHWEQEGDLDTYWTQDEIVQLADTISAEPFKPLTDQARRAISNAVERL